MNEQPISTSTPQSHFRWLDLHFTGAGFLLAVFFGWFIELLYSISTSDWDALTALRTFCLLWFASGAAFFGGTIGGFLFGVPKFAAASVIDRSSAVGFVQPTEKSKLRINTNLEDISDWFTKIILGLGLVHFAKVISFISDVGDSVGSAIGQMQGAKAIAISAMIYGFVCGFLMTYIWTRTALKKEFEKAEAT